MKLVPLYTFASMYAVPGVDMSRLSDEAAIRAIARAIDLAVDQKNWAWARSYFMDQVEVDFSTVNGAPPGPIEADQLIGGWAANLGPYKTSFHQRDLGRISFEGHTARLISNGYAWNYMEGNGHPYWEVWGEYTHEFFYTNQGWMVRGMALLLTAEQGNAWVKMTPSPA